MLTRHFRIQVRNLAEWPALIGALLTHRNVEALSINFDRTDRLIPHLFGCARYLHPSQSVLALTEN